MFVSISILLGIVLLAISSPFGNENGIDRAVISSSFSIYTYILLRSVFSKEEKTATITICLFNIGVVCFPAAIQAARGYFPFYSMSYAESDVFSAATMYLVYTVCLGAAHALTYRPHKWLQRPERRFAPSSINIKAALLTYALLCAVSLIGFLVVGPSSFLSARGALFLDGQIQTPLQSLGVALVHFSGFDALAIALALLWSRAIHIYWSALLLLLAVPTFFLVNNVLNLPRYMFFAYIICLIFVYSKSSSFRFKAVFSASYLVATVTLFPILSQLSRGQRGDALLQEAGKYYATSGDFDAFQSMININRWIGSDGLQWGKQIFSALLVAVPRSVWTEKASPTGALAARHAGYVYTNISAPLPAEFYADFGWLGVVAAGLASGWALQRLDEGASSAKVRASSLGMIFYGTVVGLLSIIYRGSLIGVLGPCGLGIVLAFFVKLLVEKNGRLRPRSSDQSAASIEGLGAEV